MMIGAVPSVSGDSWIFDIEGALTLKLLEINVQVGLNEVDPRLLMICFHSSLTNYSKDHTLGRTTGFGVVDGLIPETTFSGHQGCVNHLAISQTCLHEIPAADQDGP